MTTVPYATYTLTAAEQLRDAVRTTAQRIEHHIAELDNHWHGVPHVMTGAAVQTLTSTGHMQQRTRRAADTVTALNDLASKLTTYITEARTPLEHLRRLEAESHIPVTPALATEFSAEVAYWARAYENAAAAITGQFNTLLICEAAPRWQHTTSTDGPHSAPMFDLDRPTWTNDHSRSNTTYHHSIPHDPASPEEDPKPGGPFSVGVTGMNTTHHWLKGHQDSASGSFGNNAGWNGSGEASYQAGVMATAGAGVNMSDGNLVASTHASATVGVTADAAGSINYGVLSLGGTASATAGARAGAKAEASIGKDGASLALQGDAMVGAEASLGAQLGVSGGEVGVGLTGYAGAGVNAEFDAAITLDRVALDLELGAAIGLGVGLDLSIDIDPKEVIADLGDNIDPRNWFD